MPKPTSAIRVEFGSLKKGSDLCEVKDNTHTVRQISAKYLHDAILYRGFFIPVEFDAATRRHFEAMYAAHGYSTSVWTLHSRIPSHPPQTRALYFKTKRQWGWACSRSSQCVNGAGCSFSFYPGVGERQGFCTDASGVQAAMNA
jgi:hypothetical protein